MNLVKARFFAAFMFMLGLFIVAGLFVAHSSEIKVQRQFKETDVYTFCSRPDIIDYVNGLFARGDAMAGKYLLQKAIDNGECVNTAPYPVKFMPKRIVRRYTAEESGAKPEIVFEGSLVRTGQTAYVWSDEELEANFYEPDEKL